MRNIFSILFVLMTTTQAQADDTEYSAAELKQALERVKHHHGGQSNLFLISDRFEYQSNESDPITLWDVQGWYGTDINKFWVKSEGEFINDTGEFEEAELQGLYSRAISSFWDFQAGLRHDIKPTPSRTYGVIGFQGLAPYWFEVDTAAFVSEKGKVSFRLETEYELLITQRLILQPRVEVNLALQDDPDIHSGSGINNIDAGLRLRYEIVREFAPYIGFSWSRKFGETADFARADGEQRENLSLVAGFRMWY